MVVELDDYNPIELACFVIAAGVVLDLARRQLPTTQHRPAGRPDGRYLNEAELLQLDMGRSLKVYRADGPDLELSASVVEDDPDTFRTDSDP